MATKIPQLVDGVDFEQRLRSSRRGNSSLNTSPRRKILIARSAILAGEPTPEAARAELRDALARDIEEEHTTTHGRGRPIHNVG